MLINQTRMWLSLKKINSSLTSGFYKCLPHFEEFLSFFLSFVRLEVQFLKILFLIFFLLFLSNFFLCFFNFLHTLSLFLPLFFLHPFAFFVIAMFSVCQLDEDKQPRCRITPFIIKRLLEVNNRLNKHILDSQITMIYSFYKVYIVANRA